MNLASPQTGSTFGHLAEPLYTAESSSGMRRETDTPQERDSTKEELAPHVHDITRALGDKVSEQEIERELSSYLNVYRVSLDTAKRSIVKKHGGNPATLAVGVSKTLRELVPGEQSVNLLVRIVSVNEKDVTVEGETKRILYGILGDPTTTIPFTAWEPLPMTLAKGDIVRVQNAYSKEYRGQVQVNFGFRTVVAKEAADALPEYKPGTGAPYLGKPTPVRVVDLREGASNVQVTARILSVERREVEVDGTPKAVFSGILADETGKTQFSAWKDFGLADGEVIRIDGSGALTAVFDRELTEALLDKTLDACIEAARDAMSTDVVRDELADVLVAQPIEVRGDVTSDDYGLMMIVASAKMLKVDVQTEAREMLEGLEGSA